MMDASDLTNREGLLIQITNRDVADNRSVEPLKMMATNHDGSKTYHGVTWAPVV